MNDHEIKQARALKECSLRIGRDRSFVDSMNWIAEQDHHRWLSPKQKDYLTALCWRYRRQLVALNHREQVPHPSTMNPRPSTV